MKKNITFEIFKYLLCVVLDLMGGFVLEKGKVGESTCVACIVQRSTSEGRREEGMKVWCQMVLSSSSPLSLFGDLTTADGHF